MAKHKQIKLKTNPSTPAPVKSSSMFKHKQPKCSSTSNQKLKLRLVQTTIMRDPTTTPTAKLGLLRLDDIMRDMVTMTTDDNDLYAPPPPAKHSDPDPEVDFYTDRIRDMKITKYGGRE